MSSKLLNRAQVLERLGNRSVSWLYEEMGADRFPRPVRLGKWAVAWIESEIDDYIEKRIAEGRVRLTPRIRRRKSEPTPAAA
jgi:prophage regulatory protein